MKQITTLVLAIFFILPLTHSQRIIPDIYNQKKDLLKSELPNFSKAKPYKKLNNQSTETVCPTSIFKIEHFRNYVRKQAGMRTYFEDEDGDLKEVAGIVMVQYNPHIAVVDYGKFWTVIENNEVLFIDLHVVDEDEKNCFFRQFYQYKFKRS